MSAVKRARMLLVDIKLQVAKARGNARGGWVTGGFLSDATDTIKLLEAELVTLAIEDEDRGAPVLGRDLAGGTDFGQVPEITAPIAVTNTTGEPQTVEATVTGLADDAVKPQRTRLPVVQDAEAPVDAEGFPVGPSDDELDAEMAKRDPPSETPVGAGNPPGFKPDGRPLPEDLEVAADGLVLDRPSAEPASHWPALRKGDRVVVFEGTRPGIVKQTPRPVDGRVVVEVTGEGQPPAGYVASFPRGDVSFPTNKTDKPAREVCRACGKVVPKRRRGSGFCKKKCESGPNNEEAFDGDAFTGGVP